MHIASRCGRCQVKPTFPVVNVSKYRHFLLISNMALKTTYYPKWKIQKNRRKWPQQSLYGQFCRGIVDFEVFYSWIHDFWLLSIFIELSIPYYFVTFTLKLSKICFPTLFRTWKLWPQNNDNTMLPSIFDFSEKNQLLYL